MSDCSTNPLISVIVPCYNGSRHLAEALFSVTSQTYQNWECIIVNDGSTDTSPEIAGSFCSRDTRFKLVTKANGGLASARNTGIDRSEGDFLAFLDADDKWHPDKLVRHLSCHIHNPNIGVTYSWTSFIDEDGNPLNHYRKPPTRDLSDYYLFCRNPITNGSNGVFRKEVFKLHKFDERLSHNQDVDCWFRIAFTPPRRWTFQGIPCILTYYRVSPGGLSNDFQTHYQCCQAVWDKVLSYNPQIALKYRKTAEAFQLRFYSRRAIASKDYVKARYFIKQALFMDFSIAIREPVSTLATLIASFVPVR